MKKITSVFIALLLISSFAYAHGGRTDSHGGHKDNKNASGLGPYHYHCGGYPPHLHSNGICPYTAVAEPVVPSPTPQPAQPVINAKPIKVIVNGALVTMIDVEPFIESGRTYVPLRSVLEAYGVDSISWNDPVVTITYNDIVLDIEAGHNTMKRNGYAIPLDCPAINRSGRFCLPIRAVIEALGGTIRWDGATRTVIIDEPAS